MDIRKKKHLRIFNLVFVLGIIVIFGIMSGQSAKAAEASAADAPILRVVLPNFDDTGFVKLQQSGVGGYYMEYLNEIAKYTGWEYDYRVISDEAEMQKIVDAADYDLLLGVMYTQEDDELYFDFPKESLADRHLVLATSKTRMDLNGSDINSLHGIRVGVIDTEYSRNLEAMFEGYCTSNGLAFTVNSPQPVERGINVVTVERDERFELLETGELDALILTGSQALDHDLYVVSIYGSVPMYAVVPNGDDRYIQQLDDAINSILRLDNSFTERLHDKYFSANQEVELSFTAEERDFLNQKNRQYTVALWDNCAPYAYLRNNGKWNGVAVEVFEAISEMTSDRITFKFVSYPDSFAANEALAAGEVDILGQTFTSVKIEERGLNRSNSYYSDSFQMYQNAVSQKGFENAHIVVKKDISNEMLYNMGVQDTTQITRVDSVVDALQMVNSGEADMTFALQNVADYYISYYRMTNLMEHDIQSDVNSFCCVYGTHVDELAKVICNRCISYVDRDMLDRTITDYILTEHEPVSLREYIKANFSNFAIFVIVALSALITGLVIVVFTIHNKSKRIYEMLYRDDITSGSSYLKFEEDVRKIAGENKEKYYIIFADIHNFKYINDVFGYDCGNQVLCSVEDFIQTLTGGLPYARMYADHFVGIRRYSDKKEMSRLMNERVGSFAYKCSIDYPEFNVFLKIGIYEWDGQNLEHIRQYVNLANYAADGIKNLSGSEYCFYTMEMHDKILSRQEIEKDMHRAMKAREFVAFYQPKYDIETNQIIGAEALVRWNHKTKGLISPGMFIPIFEENGFIIDVDFRMLEHVCTFLAERIAKGKSVYPISCNFSRRHFQQSDFVERLTKVVAGYKVPPNLIEIEITETVATEDFPILVRTVKELKEKGFQISIDDFGSGYSCIQLLYKLPIDVLKLDRVFVISQDVNKKEEDINRSIINVCHEHDIKIICEGVETEEQKQFVSSYGCRFVQGYLYSKPVTRDVFIEMLDRDAV